MPATAARATFIRNAFRRVVASTSAMQVRYGNLARISDDPIETFFDSVANAQIIADARQALLGTERRRFKPVVNDATDALALAYSQSAPLGRYIDTERSADMTVIISDMVIDLEKNSATFTVWGGDDGTSIADAITITADTTLITSDTTIITADEG
jgi:hypothetical protein